MDCGGRAVLRFLAGQRMVHGGRVPVFIPPRAVGFEVRRIVGARLRRAIKDGFWRGRPAGVRVVRGYNPATRFVHLQADRGRRGEGASVVGGGARLMGGTGSLCVDKGRGAGTGAGRSG